MPSLRSEELYLIHFQVTGDVTALDRAYAILEAKAATITDPDHRRVFLTRVPVSAAIMAARRSR
ncbi:hypothetical protein [Actinoplanes sp. NPDC051851]|uniref:hypothetical protein n=1 Tax=Actinoplanes sp. NPDC051851 TaxID=3154753 RepID=UPI00343607E8